MKENVKVQNVVIFQNESLKKMVANLEDEIQECKRLYFEINDLLNKIEFKETLKEEKMDTTRRDVSEMKNVCTMKSWADVCGQGCGIKLIYYACDEPREEYIESIDVR